MTGIETAAGYRTEEESGLCGLCRVRRPNEAAGARVGATCARCADDLATEARERRARRMHTRAVRALAEQEQALVETVAGVTPRDQAAAAQAELERLAGIRR